MTNNIPQTCGDCEYRRTFTPEGFPFANCQLKRDLGFENSHIYDRATKNSGNFYARVYCIRDKDCPLTTDYQKESEGNHTTNEEAVEDCEDVKLIHTNGLDESIRCTLCTNPRANERGCDGNCQVNECLYNEVMNTIHLFVVKEGENG